ncbi:MAG TPA: transketolase C-terminal domain-containing protein [Bacteroidia bacterium]|jgi:transketolase|nr:transketolase C-terminal domain-containing protein [Bacteroidia bacterium]
MSYEELIKEIALKDERFVVMTAENRAVVRNLPGVLKDRFIDTGITEQTMIGAAAGLALRGRIPVVHALSAFLSMRAFEFIRTDVGIANLPVKLSSWIPGFLSDANGPTHQAIEDVSIMRGIPGMQVFCPADEGDMLHALPVIWNSPHPSYVRVITRKCDFKHDPHFEIGKAEVVAKGTDVTLMVYGLLFEETLKTKALLEKEGLSVGLINMRSLKPVDEKAILEAARNTQLIVSIEDHFQTGGLYTILAEVFLKHRIAGNVLSLALQEKWFKPALLSEVLHHEGFTGEKMAAKILTELTKKTLHKA